MEENLYLIVDGEDVPVSHGHLLTPHTAPQVKVRVEDDDKNDEIAALPVVKLVALTQKGVSMQGKVDSCEDGILLLSEVISGEEIRETLRVDCPCDTLIYPVNSSFHGRRKAQLVDLSCGGVAFLCEESFRVGDQMEIVIPMTSPQPVILRCQILRARSVAGMGSYAAKFVGMCHEEERIICEAVFAIQLQQHNHQV